MQQSPRSLIAPWWNDSPETWLPEFLESRGVLRWIRLSIIIGAPMLTFPGILLMFSDWGPHDPAARFVDGMAIAVGPYCLLRWLLCAWPTPRSSLRLVVMIDLAITASAFSDAVPLAGLASTSGFVCTGIYLAVFHSGKAQSAHISWSILTTVGLMTAVYSDPSTPGGWAVATALGISCLTTDIGVMPMVQLTFSLVRRSAVDSLIDPLTGLANRRGLDHQLNIMPARSGTRSMCVIAIDLDRFKAVNDRFGHPTGDSLLIQVADRIQQAMSTEAVIARVGGEEFVAIDLLDPSPGLCQVL
ncbi:diguanylate cyclase [Mycobacterium sp. M1]|uniref:Diguanylate cyclase n=1 Tax=Mycolicibacter acidiphilus TaxID=2835306 RepID=A0ABS5RJ33_9MYCO|nr:diguanylate cyclase [Mycolicibacter acidiphilus]MBS9533481.1 diguanylate cyclase [Mycolicibacter acidiphilus]